MLARQLTGGHMRARTRLEHGAVAVEFALVLPVLVALMLGVVSFGMAYNAHVGLSNAVREGSRMGATTVNNTNWPSAVVLRTTSLYFNSDSPLLADQVCAKLVKWTTSTSPEGTPSPEQASSCSASLLLAEPPVPNGVAPGTCIVKVWAAKPATLNWLLGSSTITLKAQSVSYFERTPCVPTP